MNTLTSTFHISDRLKGVRFTAVFDPRRANTHAQVHWVRRMPVHKYTLEFGLLDTNTNSSMSLSIPLVAHEALHASRKVVSGNWRDWAPAWPCHYPREETHAWVIESIVGGVLRAAAAHGIPFSFTQRTNESSQ